MVFAGYSEQGDPAIARLLVERGANVNEANEAGATALTFAMKSGPHSQLVAFLRQAGARTPPAVPSAKAFSARHMPDDVPVRDRAQRAIDLLQRASTGFVDNRFVRDEAKCVSRHHQSPGGVGGGGGGGRGPAPPAAPAGPRWGGEWGGGPPREDPGGGESPPK